LQIHRQPALFETFLLLHPPAFPAMQTLIPPSRESTPQAHAANTVFDSDGGPYPPSTPQAILVSVGGSPEPLRFLLNKTRPRLIIYFCSHESRKTADAIHAGLDWHPDRDFIETGRGEELGPCYKELRTQLPGLLKKWKLHPADVVVDYTGGTKSMSAALVLAASEIFSRFSYIGGEQREKAGLGVVVDGKSRVLYQGNPWQELAIREIERARDLWRHAIYEGAAAVLRDVGGRAAKPVLFEKTARLCDATAARHRLDFAAAQKLFGQLKRSLPDLFAGSEHGRPPENLVAFTESSLKICAACAGKQPSSESLLAELLDNALRTAAQGRYEDAAARLYRAMELQGQLWLSNATGGLFKNGQCRRADADKLPSALKQWLDEQHPATPSDADAIKLSLEQLFHALARTDAAGKVGKIIEDLALDKASRLRHATQHRNTSILAHGTSAIGAEGFYDMKAIASEFFAFDLASERHPFPEFDFNWLGSHGI
jgi:CRISPR-associated protein (TIGR02710 family)